MFGSKKTVLEMAAGAASAGGGAQGYAGFWARVAALMVDSAILMIAGVVLFVVLGMALGGTGLAIGNILFLFAQLLYWPVMESSARQATFGKGLLGIEVTDLEGNRVSFIKALLRNLAKIISYIPLGIGFLLAAFTGRKQALHDIITGCLVVRSGPSNFLKAVVAAVVGLVIAIGAAYYYVTKVYLPQQMEQTTGGGGKDFQRAMEKAMKDAGKDMARDMEKAMKEAEKDQKRQRELATKDAQKGAPPTQPATVTATPKPGAKVAPAPSAPPASAPAAAAAPKAGSLGKPVAMAEAAPAKSATPSSKAKAAPQPTSAAAPSGEDKPATKRSADKRKPAAAPAETAAMASSGPAKTPKYNDVMTAVMNRDGAGAAEALELGFWVDRPDSNGVTPLMVAARNGDVDMTELLLRHGADPNRGGPGGSVLAYAARGGNAKVADLLRRAGAR
jgi:uncharacterized RDD family membrane protein YckC